MKKYMLFFFFAFFFFSISLFAQEQAYRFYSSNPRILEKEKSSLASEVKKFIRRKDFKSAAVFLGILRSISSPDDKMVEKLSALWEKESDRYKIYSLCHSQKFIIFYQREINTSLENCRLEMAEELYKNLKRRCRNLSSLYLRKLRIKIKEKKSFCRQKAKRERKIAIRNQKLIKELIKKRDFSAASKLLAESKDYLTKEKYDSLETIIREGLKMQERQKIDEKISFLKDKISSGDLSGLNKEIKQLAKSTKYNQDYCHQKIKEVKKALALKLKEQQRAKRQAEIYKLLQKISLLKEAEGSWQRKKVSLAKKCLKRLKALYPYDKRVLALEKEIAKKENEFRMLLEEIGKLLSDGYYLSAARITTSLENDYPGFSSLYKERIKSFWQKISLLYQKEKESLIDNLRDALTRNDYSKAEKILAEMEEKYPQDEKIKQFSQKIKTMLKEQSEKEKRLREIKKLKAALEKNSASLSGEVKSLIKKVEK